MYFNELQINPALLENGTSDAIQRIAAGIRVVQRSGNPNREFSLTFQHLGKLNPIKSQHLLDLADCWRCVVSDNSHGISPLIIGLTESGIVPAFAMNHACEKLGIRTLWSNSSRDIFGEISFMEPHSHAPCHFLSASEVRQDGFSELWIVDDEITTGATLVNLLVSLSQIRLFQTVRIFTILDNRDASSDLAFGSLAKRLGISIKVISLIVFSGNPRVFPIAIEHEEEKNGLVEFVWGELISKSLPTLLKNPEKHIQQVTLSRWMVDGHSVWRHTQINKCYSIYNAQDEVSVTSILNVANNSR